MQQQPITFPTPSPGLGTVTHMALLVANPNWRWWSFWRPRTIMLDWPVDPPRAIGAGDTLTPGRIEITEA